MNGASRRSPLGHALAPRTKPPGVARFTGPPNAAPTAARKPLRRTSSATPCAGRCMCTRRSCRGHNDPAALGVHEIPHVVIWAFVARLGHDDVVPRAARKLIQPCVAGLANGLRCLYVSAQVVAVQMSDVRLSFVDVSP